MEINKVQWRMIAKGEKLPCDSFLMRKDGTIPSVISSAGVTVGQDAYYLPVEELRSFPKEENYDERMIQYFKDLAPFDKAEELYEKYGFSHNDAIDWLEKQTEQKPTELPKGEDYGIDSLWHAQRILEETLGKVEGYQSDDGILEHKCAIEAVNRLYEQKPAWSKEDEMMMMFCCDYLDDNQKSWLLSLKDRVQPQPRQEWSEEDEKIRKDIVTYLKSVIANKGYRDKFIESWIAWLEKQGEQKSVDDLTPQEAMDIAVAKCFEEGEQKSDDKVEPKFKVGDYVVGKYISGYISEVRDDCYLLDYQGFPIDKQDNYHLWTIQDAKDGDVLINWSNTAFIFKAIEDETVKFHIAYNEKWDEIKTPSTKLSHLGLPEPQFEFHPATKEQRDQLEKAMADAGYTFDFEKKELKKVEQKPTEEYNITGIGSKNAQGKLGEMIMNLKSVNEVLEQKPAWSEEDELYIRELERLVKQVWAIAEHENDKDTIHKMSDLSFFLKTLKPQPKQEWGEEDEKMIGNIRRIIEQYALSKSAVDVNGELCEKEFIDADNWLKSLRPQNKTYYWTENEIKFAISDYIRGVESYEKMVEKLRCLKPHSQWKPSEEQMEALDEYVYAKYPNTEKYGETIISLVEQLKKLREE